MRSPPHQDKIIKIRGFKLKRAFNAIPAHTHHIAALRAPKCK
jgi:hypothetical protein